MTNQLVGDVYQKIIEDVISTSTTDFEESGVSQSLLEELQQGWQARLSQQNIATMPWDPKPAPPSPKQQPQPQPSLPSAVPNGLPPPAYQKYDTPPANAAVNGAQIKTESVPEPQYNGLPNGYAQGPGPAQGGLARAQHLVQQQYPNASINAMQQRAGGGLALPGQQQQQQAKPQGLHLPGGQTSPQNPQQQFTAQQQQMMQRQQQQLQQQQAQPRIKVENESPQMPQGSFQQPNYNQTDGADDSLEQWQAMLAERRATSVEQTKRADRMMRDQVTQLSAELESGLMVPLDEQPSKRRRKGKAAVRNPENRASSSLPTIPQLDGDFDDDEEKPNIKDEDDENAINSDLDDSDEEDKANLEDNEGEGGDGILCTYDKVQRVKNKWKCTLKDGVMSVNGKEWVFHKGMGEFEW